jgi:pyridoxal biosynthesis lyase PdxS
MVSLCAFINPSSRPFVVVVSLTDRVFQFSGSGIFKSSDPPALAKAIVQAVTHYNNPAILADISTGLGEAMKGEGDLKRPGVEQLSGRGY